MEFKECLNEREVEQLCALAKEIWTEHYIPIIGEKQVQYMLENLQSPAAVTAQIQSGYRYFLAVDDAAACGYCAVRQEDASAVFLSKIYIRNSYRNRRLGTRLLDYSLKNLHIGGSVRLWLTVNKDNANSIAAYKKMGFVIIEEMISDIGGGFVMDDYKMEMDYSL